VHTTGIYSKFKYASNGYKAVEKIVNDLAANPSCLTKVTILRPTMIYGDMCDRNISKFIRMVDRFRIMPVINKGNNLIQPVNARDLGSAFYKVLMYPEITIGKDYDLSGDKPIKMIDVLMLISKELNKNTIYFNVPINFGTYLARALKLITLGKFDFIEKVQRMGEDRSYDHTKATNDFGYNPMSFEQGIKFEVREYLKKKNN
jgi:nucleoside-diphosphate-sugar epimerase